MMGSGCMGKIIRSKGSSVGAPDAVEMKQRLPSTMVANQVASSFLAKIGIGYQPGSTERLPE